MLTYKLKLSAEISDLDKKNIQKYYKYHHFITFYYS
jgi:hypothetical protein